MRNNHDKAQKVSVRVLALSAFVGFLFSFFMGLLFGWVANKTLMFELALLGASVFAMLIAGVVHWAASAIAREQHKDLQELQTWARRFLHDPEHFSSSPTYQFAPFDPVSCKAALSKNIIDPDTQLMLAISELYQRWQEARSHQTGRLGELLAQQKNMSVGDEAYVEKQLSQYLSNAPQHMTGKLFLLDTNQEQIVQVLKEHDIDSVTWLSDIVAELASYSHRFEQSVLFHYGAGGVLLVIPKLSSGEHTVVSEKLLSIVLDRLPHRLNNNFVHIGVQDIDVTQNASTQLQRVKLALYAAKQKQASCWWNYDIDALKGDIVASDERWKTRLQSIIDRHDIVMVTHPVFISRTLNINHYELKANIRDSHGTLVNELVFLPVAFHLHMHSEIDKVVVKRSLELLEYEQKDSNSYSVKLHAESLLNEGFFTGLLAQLSAKKKLAKRLMIEVKHAELTANSSDLASVFTELQALGIKLIVNEVSLQQESWKVFEAFDIAQLKVAPVLIRDMDKSEQRTQQFAELYQFAKSINAKVVACGVSSTAEWKVVQQLNVYSAEGNYFSQGMSAIVGLQIA